MLLKGVETVQNLTGL